MRRSSMSPGNWSCLWNGYRNELAGALGQQWSSSIIHVLEQNLIHEHRGAEDSMSSVNGALKHAQVVEADASHDFIHGAHQGFCTLIGDLRLARPDEWTVAPNPALLGTVLVPPESVAPERHGAYWARSVLYAFLATRNTLDDLANEWLADADSFVNRTCGMGPTGHGTFVQAAAETADDFLTAGRAACRTHTV